MKKEDIKRIIIVFNDNDFIRVFDYIGKLLLFTFIHKNVCDEEMLNTSEEIEEFVFSMLPIAIQTAQYNEQRVLTVSEIKYLVRAFSNIRFRYNFDLDDRDFRSGGCETLIIDIEQNTSYIH